MQMSDKYFATLAEIRITLRRIGNLLCLANLYVGYALMAGKTYTVEEKYNIIFESIRETG